MLPVKLKLVSIKNILSRWLHIGCLASHIIFTCWPTQRVGLSHFCFLFFTGQLNVLAFYNVARWISSALVSRLPTCSENTS